MTGNAKTRRRAKRMEARRANSMEPSDSGSWFAVASAPPRPLTIEAFNEEIRRLWFRELT